MGYSVLRTDFHPIREDETGTLRVGSTRMAIDVVLTDYNDGASPEEIARRYPVISLADIHGVIGYYLGHKAEIDAYLAEGEEAALEAEREIEATRDPKGRELVERIRKAKQNRRSGE